MAPGKLFATRRRRTAAKLAVLGTAAMTVTAAAGGAAYAGVPSGLSSGFTVQASGTGLNVNLFGNQLTGGSTKIVGAYNGDGTGSVTSTGAGWFLASQASNSVTAGPLNGSSQSQSQSLDCTGGGGGPLYVGVGCGQATAALDGSGLPQATAGGDTALLTAAFASYIQQFMGALGNQLCGVLEQLPAPLGTSLGQNCAAFNYTLDPSVALHVGHSDGSLASDANGVTVTDTSTSVTLDLFPIQLPTMSAPEDFLKVEIPKAQASAVYSDGQWSCSNDTALISISGFVVDLLHTSSMGSLPDPLEIGGSDQLSQLTSALTQIPNNPLLSITLASASATAASAGGATCGSEGADVKLLNGAPGVPGGGIDINLGGASITTATTAAGPQTAPQGGTTTTTTTTAPPTAAQTAAVVTSPTTVHTGEWWSGSMPLLAALAAVGGGLIGWPRIRRMSLVSRFVNRSGK